MYNTVLYLCVYIYIILYMIRLILEVCHTIVNCSDPQAVSEFGKYVHACF